MPSTSKASHFQGMLKQLGGPSHETKIKTWDGLTRNWSEKPRAPFLQNQNIIYLLANVRRKHAANSATNQKCSFAKKV